MKKTAQQPRIAGVVRIPSSESLLPETKHALIEIAHKHGVSLSWVKNTILNDAVRVRAPRYYMHVVKRRKRA
jgi:RNase P/RNase MRP subunit p30